MAFILLRDFPHNNQIVENYREGGRVRRRALLNLGHYRSVEMMQSEQTALNQSRRRLQQRRRVYDYYLSKIEQYTADGMTPDEIVTAMWNPRNKMNPLTKANAIHARRQCRAYLKNVDRDTHTLADLMARAWHALGRRGRRRLWPAYVPDPPGCDPKYESRRAQRRHIKKKATRRR